MRASKSASGGGLLSSILWIVLLWAAPAPAEDILPFDIPQIGGITIDGSADDWKGRGLYVEKMPSVNEAGRGQDGPAFRLGWDTRGLLVLVTVCDDVFIEYPRTKELWRYDSIELFVSVRKGAGNYYQSVFSPGLDPKHPKMRHYIYDYRSDLQMRRQPITFEAVSTKTGTGYLFEVLLPWSNLAIKPKAGRKVGFQIVTNDADRHYPPHKLAPRFAWFPNAGTAGDPTAMHSVRLAATASAGIMGENEIRRELAKEGQVDWMKSQPGQPFFIWASVDGTLVHVDKRTRQIQKFDSMFGEPARITSLEVTSDRLWVGTKNGLISYDPWIRAWSRYAVNADYDLINAEIVHLDYSEKTKDLVVRLKADRGEKTFTYSTTQKLWRD